MRDLAAVVQAKHNPKDTEGTRRELLGLKTAAYVCCVLLLLFLIDGAVLERQALPVDTLCVFFGELPSLWCLQIKYRGCWLKKPRTEATPGPTVDWGTSLPYRRLLHHLKGVVCV